MGKFFHRKCWSIWIACFAILLNALAPSVSHAFAAAHGQPPLLIEICSVGGTRFVALDVSRDQAPTGEHRTAGTGEHCPFCFTHAGGDALPSAALPDLRRAALPAEMPRLFYQAPRLLFNWSAAHPRGPPPTLS